MRTTTILLLTAGTMAVAAPSAAQTGVPPVTSAAAAASAGLPGFAEGSAQRQLRAEVLVLEAITPALLDSLAALFAAVTEPHIGGSDAQARTRDIALGLTRAWGLRSEAPAYEVYLPWADTVAVEIVGADGAPSALVLGEPVMQGDPATASQYPWVNGYSGVGTAESDVVYVNYGLHEDYAELERTGVSVAGRVAIARYGRSFRGIKARLAEQHGAVALLMYSDPRDDGYYRGDPYPDGAWRAADAAQRGSIMNGVGDPTTPMQPSTPGAERVDPAAAALPHIPVVPLSWRAARPILERLEGADLPQQSWQGALPFRYHVGPGPVRVRVHVGDDRETAAYKTIWNTIAWLPGAERPDEWIIVGGHRDAWGAGAMDNVSGTTSVLAAAHALARLGEAGIQPRRTIVFATWDAEEWGLIGSTEWVEQLADALDAKVVAYLNQDGVAGGPSFGAAASPALEALLHGATAAVPSPADSTRSVYDVWRESSGRRNAGDASAADAPPIGNLGGGSDHAPFYNHLGVASAGWGFGGSGTQYHSAYDTRAWMERYGDPGYLRHAATARIAALMALRLANADVLPFDYQAYATELRQLLGGVAAEAGRAGMDAAALEPVERALRDMGRSAAGLAAARAAWLAGARRPAAQADSANRHLMRVERALTRPEGLRGRPWYRNLMFAADAENGYATLAFPSLVEAIRGGDTALFWAEARDLSVRLSQASAHLRAAETALRSERR